MTSATRDRLWLFLPLLVVPALAFATSIALMAHFDSQLREAVWAQYPDADESRVDALDARSFCGATDRGMEDFCATIENVALMHEAALISGIVGLALLLLIRVAGAITGRSRVLLLFFFRPGLYLTVLVLSGLVLVHAGLFGGMLFYGESALVGMVHAKLIGVVGIGAAIGAFAMMRGTFSVIKKAKATVIGVPLARADAPHLWDFVNHIATQIDALPPEHIVVGLDPNFFVTEAEIRHLEGTLTGRTLYCSLPLCRILSRGQFRSIVGHELAHFKGNDVKFSRYFYPIYRGTATSLSSLFEVAGSGATAIAVLPAIPVLTFFLTSFSVAERRLSRDRELAADAVGASVTDAETTATALVKVHAIDVVWMATQHGLQNLARKNMVLPNISERFAEVAHSHLAKLTDLNKLAGAHLPHPTDTHPPLAARMAALGVDLASVAEQALDVAPSDPAIALVANAEPAEVALSRMYQEILIDKLGGEDAPHGEEEREPGGDS